VCCFLFPSLQYTMFLADAQPVLLSAQRQLHRRRRAEPKRRVASLSAENGTIVIRKGTQRIPSTLQHGHSHHRTGRRRQIGCSSSSRASVSDISHVNGIGQSRSRSSERIRSDSSVSLNLPIGTHSSWQRQSSTPLPSHLHR